MSVTTPAFTIPRRTVAGNENEFVKIFDPPTASPATPELLDPTNPVPEFMFRTAPWWPGNARIPWKDFVQEQPPHGIRRHDH